MPSKQINQALEKDFLRSYESYSDAIFRFILFKIDNREKALDMMQETFMKTWVHISKEGKLDNTRAFLYKVAGNMVIDEYRRRGLSGYKTESLENLSESGFEPSEDINNLERLIDRLDGVKVMNTASTLPEIYSSVLFMKYSEDLSIGEIAKNSGVTENVISVRLNRALKKLREIIEKEEEKYEKSQ